MQQTGEYAFGAAPSRAAPRRRAFPLAPYLYLLPAFTLYMVFFIGPVLYSWYLSLLDWNLVGPNPRFVGLENYGRVLSSAGWWHSFGLTVLYVLGSVPTAMALGLLAAILVEQGSGRRAAWRAIFFIPVVTTIASVSLIWTYLFNYQIGVINQVLRAFGIEGPNWLVFPGWAMVALCIVGVWKVFGYNMVLFIGGLKTIDRQLYEAAKIDGATEWQQFWHITWPLLSPTTFFVLIISIISSFQVFATVEIMTKGGPNNATDVMVYHIWQFAFQFFDVGYASASATLLFLIVCGLTVAQFSFGERRVHYQ